MAQELLASDVDALFENKNLEEVQLVLRKMRLEVEKKREELRVTVGYSVVDGILFRFSVVYVFSSFIGVDIGILLKQLTLSVT